MSPRLVVSVHDVAPATAAQARQWCADLDARGVPVALLVVPGPWRTPLLRADPELAGWLRERVAGGDEVVQHGWSHDSPTEVRDGQWWQRAVARMVARGAAEFATLTEEEAIARAAVGRAELAALGLPADGFTPPGWLASTAAVRALRQLGYRYVTSHAGVRDLRTGGWHPALALCHRAGGIGERLGARLLPAAARYTLRLGRDVRIALHPDDLGRPGLRDAALRAIDRCLALGARPVTYLGLLDTAAWTAG